MKTDRELIALKSEWDSINKKISELSEEEMKKITGGKELLLSGNDTWAVNVSYDGKIIQTEKSDNEQAMRALFRKQVKDYAYKNIDGVSVIAIELCRGDGTELVKRWTNK